ncbi:MAG: serine hydrolase, partial [Lachnospiraceae bacterium]|nr:serine hydrolase [Lachnospiraceae bacterium]
DGTAKNIFLPDKNMDKIISMAYETDSYFVGPLDIKSDKPCYYKKPYKRVAMASLTKLMTALIVLENVKDLSTTYYVSQEAVDIDKDASRADLKVGDTISVKDLLYGLLIPSGNDAANVLAENMDESKDNFLILMNNEAERIGCLNTHFSNAHGLDEEYHFTTAYDLYIILTHLLKYPLFSEITRLKEYTTNILQSDGTYRKTTWQNTNYFLTGDYLLYSNAVLLASKTGTTTNAGYCMAMVTKSKTTNVDYITIVLHAYSKSRLYSCLNAMIKSTH